MNPNPTVGRIIQIDAARGLVMLFSCLSHFAWWIHATYPDAGDALGAMGMVATPTFLLISGAMAGLLSTGAPSGRNKLKSQLFNRGLFLLTVGHVLISLAEAHRIGGVVHALGASSVVDVIGLCTLIASLSLRHIADARICNAAASLAAVVLVVAWAFDIIWHPQLFDLLAVDKVLIAGDIGNTTRWLYTAPTLQYMAVYVLGLPIGHQLRRYVAGELSATDIAGKLLRMGLALIAIACTLRLARPLAETYWPSLLREITATLSATQKMPPSPVYLMFFGGSGLTLIACLIRVWQAAHPVGRALIQWLEPIGRASLFIFIFQYFLYWTLPDLLGIEPGPLAGLYFAANVAVVHYAAVLWLRLGGNRWMTFGITFGNLQTQRR